MKLVHTKVINILASEIEKKNNSEQESVSNIRIVLIKT